MAKPDCVDYRKVNSFKRDDAFPLFRIEDIFAKFQGKKYFCSLDMGMAYHQICVNERDKCKTAFVIEYCLYEYTRMPFGLKTAPPT